MDARTDSTQPSRAVVERAAAWHAQVADEDWDQARHVDLNAWLDADPMHRLAFERMAAIEGRVADGSALLRRSRQSHHHSGATIGLLALVAGSLTWLSATTPTVRASIADEKTGTGEQRHAQTPSGDRLTLDTRTSLDIDEDSRAIWLWRGGLLANVAENGILPFVVHTPQGTARALGTQFDVRIADGVTRVDVYESRVEVCADGAQACLALEAGESARIDSDGVGRLADIDIEDNRAWSEGWLVAKDRALTEVLDELNRYRSEPVRYTSAELRDLRISGTLSLRDTDRALSSVEAALPVRVERSASGVRIRRR